MFPGKGPGALRGGMVSGRLNIWRQRGWREWLIVLQRRLVPGSRRTARIAGGLRLRVRLKDELAPSYLLGREFEPEVAGFLEAFLKPGDTCIDMGANIGHMTIVAAARVGDAGRVIAFEPSPAEFRELTLNIALNRFRNVEAFAMAVTDKGGVVSFHLAGEGLGLYNSTGTPFRSSGTRAIEVPSVPLDDFLEERGIDDVALVKMDIEGGESAALTGGERCFGRPNSPVVVCEFSDVAGTATGQTTHHLWERFRELGFTLYQFERLADRLVLGSASPKPHYDYENLVAIKPTHLARLRECGLLPLT